jgi:hypothetical protein
MDSYVETLNNVGESIIAWADPESKYRGHTDVSGSIRQLQLAFHSLTDFP